MASLRFSFGTMGSGKSTVALQIHHNLASRHLYGLLLTSLDRAGQQVTSRLGVAAPAIDGVQRSPRYPGGVALRFARVKRYRPDKTPADADPITALQAML